MATVKNTSSIGAGFGRDYVTATAWETATSINLTVGDGQIEVGELYNDAVFAESPRLLGATTDAGRFRVVAAVDGDAYDPISGTGVLFLGAHLVRASEGFVRFEKFGVRNTGTGVGQSIRADSTYALVEKCYADRRLATSPTQLVVYDPAAAGTSTTIIRRCISTGGGAAAGVGAAVGFYGAGLLLESTGYGFGDPLGSGYVATTVDEVINSVGSDTDTLDFNATAESYCSSEDASAGGTGSITGHPAAEVFRDAAHNDFRPKAGSPTVDSGCYVVPRKPDNPNVVLTDDPPGITDGLVLCLPLCEGFGATAADISGNGNDGTIDLTGQSWTRGLPHCVLDFDGTDTAPLPVTLTSGLPLYSVAGTWSVSMWVNSDMGGQYYLWVENDSGAGLQVYGMYLGVATVGFFIRDDAGAVLLNSSAAHGASAGEWLHIAFTDDDGDISLRVNDVEKYTASYTRSAITLDTLDLAPGPANNFVGQIAGASAWSRALTAAEIAALYSPNPWAMIGGPAPTDFAGVTLPQRDGYDMGPYELPLSSFTNRYSHQRGPAERRQGARARRAKGPFEPSHYSSPRGRRR